MPPEVERAISIAQENLDLQAEVINLRAAARRLREENRMLAHYRTLCLQYERIVASQSRELEKFQIPKGSPTDDIMNSAFRRLGVRS